MRTLASLFRPLTLTALLLAGVPGLPRFLPAAAGQSSPPSAADNKVYTYTEQMPMLPSGGSTEAIVAAIMQRLVLPTDRPLLPSKRVFVQFTVGKRGEVESSKIVKGLSPAVDAAVLAAVGRLPTFSPAKQGGQPVRLSYTIGLTLPDPAESAAAPAPDGPAAEAASLRFETQTIKQGVAQRRSGEADTAFLRRVLPASFPRSNDLLAATWRPSAFGKQLFFSVQGPSNNEYGTDLFMLDPFQANTYAVQVFTIPTQGDATGLEAFFFADVDQDGQKELLAISECSLRGGRDSNGLHPRTSHYQTLVFQHTGLSSTGRPQYQDYPKDTSYLDELATAAEVRQALARALQRRKTPPHAPAKAAKK